jgi:hypothetical protein
VSGSKVVREALWVWIERRAIGVVRSHDDASLRSGRLLCWAQRQIEGFIPSMGSSRDRSIETPIGIRPLITPFRGRRWGGQIKGTAESPREG